MKAALLMIMLLLAPTAYGSDRIPALEDLPHVLSDAERTRFLGERRNLEAQLAAFQAAGNAFNSKRAEDQTDEEFSSLQSRQAAYIAAARAFNEQLEISRGLQIQSRMIKSLQGEAWTDDEKERARNALLQLDEDGSATSSTKIRNTWRDVQARRNDAGLAKEASGGRGPGLPGAGNQTVHEDCVIFALANAANVPYGVVAARATALLAKGDWRPADERKDPRKVIEKDGLMGGEVILLAEALGIVNIVPSWEFAETIADGTPIMVALYGYDGDARSAHQVVLTRTFKRGDKTWYEMIDSNERGSQQRLHLSEAELLLLLRENGIVARPEKGTRPRLLRERE